MRGSDIGAWIDEDSDAESSASLTVSLTVPLIAAFFLRLTTLFFFFRPDFEFLPEPRVRPVVAELRLTKEGLAGRWPCSWLSASENVYVVAVPWKECDLARLGVDNGELWPVSTRSVTPAQALNMTSLMLGVYSESVRLVLLSVASRSMFFCEKSDWTSGPPSSERAAISD
jgi:hypothetical protein